MTERPPLNPDIDTIADQAKYRFATATEKLANLQYRLGELAGTGRLDPDESGRLQGALVQIWEDLYSGTLGAVRDENTPDCEWDEAANTYSDGSIVRIQIRVEPAEFSDFNWAHNPLTSGDGAVNEHPRGIISYVNPPPAQGR